MRRDLEPSGRPLEPTNLNQNGLFLLQGLKRFKKGLKRAEQIKTYFHFPRGPDRAGTETGNRIENWTQKMGYESVRVLNRTSTEPQPFNWTSAGLFSRTSTGTGNRLNRLNWQPAQLVGNRLNWLNWQPAQPRTDGYQPNRLNWKLVMWGTGNQTLGNRNWM